ncbi:hypothetical protein GCM10012275_64250 [Longimycelium tulufanense]|uniref:DUF3618 domain-containing protein n=1 Tax=Longimycelium tulufanense TaxID=907463 RepID=A0A8J3CF28_9PSEU|nr:hypothetical protein [Longimycelium tulufanense]GGM84684.1 hypothetical protein GCM10012275_64250 [Longimycelium tulufanense]
MSAEQRRVPEVGVSAEPSAPDPDRAEELLADAVQARQELGEILAELEARLSPRASAARVARDRRVLVVVAAVVVLVVVRWLLRRRR